MHYTRRAKLNKYKLHKIWEYAPLATGAIGLVLHAAGACAQTVSPPPVVSGPLQSVIVHGHSPAQAAKKRLSKIPGGFSVANSATVSRGRVRSTVDQLRLQPGVIAQSTGSGGFDSVKVSIRGSGVNNGVGYFRNGIKYEFDDLPVTTPSGTPYELLIPDGLAYTEILRGDNAFTTGDLALGGTINNVTKTGRTAPYTELRTEFGSFGYAKGSAATGGVFGPWDYYLNVIGEHQNGWQDHSAGGAEHIIANVGYQFNENISTRVYFRYGEEDFSSPGPLTRGQIESDHPTQANLTYLEANYRRNQPGSELLGDVTKIRLADAQALEIGLAYQNFPILIGNSSTANPTLSKYDYGNVAAQLKYTNDTQVFGHGNELTAAAYWSDDVYGDDKIEARAGDDTYPFGKSIDYLGTTSKIAATSFYGIPAVYQGERLIWNKFNGSIDETALVSNDFEALNNVWLTTGGAIVSTPRNFSTLGYTKATATTQKLEALSFDKTETNVIPRVGLRWDADPDLQLFASYGGNVEPKEDWAGQVGPNTSSVAVVPNYNILALKNQVAYTAEVGLRGQWEIFEGSADYYHANVRNELLSIFDPAIDATTTINAPPAVHQGVEAALDTVLWQWGEGDYWSADPQVAQLHLIQTYTYSNFHFVSGQFGHNEEPGLPQQYYQGELAFSHPSGFYTNFDALVSGAAYVDYENTFKAAPYRVFSLTVGWQQPRPDKKGWLVSLSIENLFNEKYAAAIAPTYSAAGKDAAVEYPGEGLGVYSAVDYKF